MKIRTLPSINTGYNTNLELDIDDRVIIQEKYDGSQFTIYKDEEGNLHYMNKNKSISGKGNVWLNSYLSLCKKTDFFKIGFFYHGEAMNSRQSHTVRYDREPKRFWVLYEIVRENGQILTPEEMTEHLKNTDIEVANVLYDNNGHTKETNYIDIAKDIIQKMEDGKIQSSLGGIPEGVVLKVLNRKTDTDKVRNSRFKFVRQVFSEQNHAKKEKLPTLNDDEIVQGIASVYDTDARKQKAIQHLKECEKKGWNEKNLTSNIGRMVEELDADLLKEAEEEIKDMLFIRFWPQISKGARGDLTNFIKSLEMK